jgi:hypothetical protein
MFMETHPNLLHNVNMIAKTFWETPPAIQAPVRLKELPDKGKETNRTVRTKAAEANEAPRGPQAPATLEKEDTMHASQDLQDKLAKP